jgi:hypothetical protein
MILVIALGLVTTLFGVALGGTLVELTVRAVGYSLTERRLKTLVRPTTGAPRWLAED